jgi:hypothetical protein
MATRIILVLYVLLARGCAFVLEQPMSSILPEHPRFVQFITQHQIFKVVLATAIPVPEINIVGFRRVEPLSQTRGAISEAKAVPKN